MPRRIRPIARRVMIDLLVAEGVTWAGWYRPANLNRKYDDVFAIGTGHGRPFSVIHTRAYRRQMRDRLA